LSQQELAERLYVTKGNVSGLLDRMVEAGLVERRPIPGDRRSNALYLTGQGRDLAERGIAAQRAYVTSTLGALPLKDLADLERLVLAWREKARAEEARPSPRRRRKARPMFDAVAFAGGGNRCYWQGGFWEAAAPSSGSSPAGSSGVSAGAWSACYSLLGLGRRVNEMVAEGCSLGRRNFEWRAWRGRAPLAGGRHVPQPHRGDRRRGGLRAPEGGPRDPHRAGAQAAPPAALPRDSPRHRHLPDREEVASARAPAGRAGLGFRPNSCACRTWPPRRSSWRP
jgi:hypothetical protein